MGIKITRMKGGSRKGYKTLNKTQQKTVKKRIRKMLKDMNVKAEVD